MSLAIPTILSTKLQGNRYNVVFDLEYVAYTCVIFLIINIDDFSKVLII